MMFHLKWSTLLATSLKNLAEVFDKGNRVVDRLGEGVDLFPVGACDNRNCLLLYNLRNISNPHSCQIKLNHLASVSGSSRS